MSYSQGADIGPGARWWPPDHHNFLWSFLFQERQTVQPSLCGQGCVLLWAHVILVRGHHVWGHSASCWGGILNQGHPCSCYSETWSPCPDTWGALNQSPPGCTCFIVLGSRNGGLVQTLCHCKPPMWEGYNCNFWATSEFSEASVCLHPVEYLPAWNHLGNMRTVNYKNLDDAGSII